MQCCCQVSHPSSSTFCTWRWIDVLTYSYYAGKGSTVYVCIQESFENLSIDGTHASSKPIDPTLPCGSRELWEQLCIVVKWLHECSVNLASFMVVLRNNYDVSLTLLRKKRQKSALGCRNSRSSNAQYDPRWVPSVLARRGQWTLNQLFRVCVKLADMASWNRLGNVKIIIV